MVDTQHFCLRWNNYQSSITSAFENLRDDEDFVDVTLACEGKSLKAHRVSTPCKHPVIVLQDVAFADLHALVEFIYHGEVNVHQRSLTSFLKTAEVLRVSGLTQQAEDREEVRLNFRNGQFQVPMLMKPLNTFYLSCTFKKKIEFLIFLYSAYLTLNRLGLEFKLDLLILNTNIFFP
ncbi:hypothetical protein B566_EDAN003619 [Ephemera danica]|nr:hypothetical protein B566_EDAN003619 [Ephemera danica]